MILNMRAPRDNPRVFSSSAATAPVPARVLRLVPGDVPWHEGPVRSGFLGEWRCGVLSALPSPAPRAAAAWEPCCAHRPGLQVASRRRCMGSGHHAFSRQVRSGYVYDNLCIRISLALVEAVLKKLALGKWGVAAHHATSDGIVYGCILLRHLESGASEIWA